MKENLYRPADITIYIKDRGIVLKDKSLAALDKGSRKLVAFGTEAERAAEEKGEELELLSPLRRGMIADYMVAVQMFTHFLQKAMGRKPFRRPVVAICVPRGITEVEKKAIEDAIIQSGARELVIISGIILEQVLKEMPERYPKLYQKCSVFLSVAMEEPEGYITEELKEILRYGELEGVSGERVEALLQAAARSVREDGERGASIG